MKAIIRWEQLNKKPFSQLSYSNEEEILSLFYVCTQPNKSLEDFKKDLTESSIKEMIKEFEKQISLTSQFQAISEKKKKEEDENEESNHVYIKDTVPLLVMNGLDVYYALNDMELCDLPLFLKAYDQKVKAEKESQRFEIFWMLKPHFGKDIKTPQDLYMYFWELEKESISEAKQEEAKTEFQTFLQTGLSNNN